MSDSKRWLGFLASGWRAVRDGWLILGITLLLFLGLEVVYRAEGWLAGRFRTPATAKPLPHYHPYADSAWFPAYLREKGALKFQWEPFVYTRGRPQRGEYLNIDSAGQRVVPKSGTGVPLRVFAFGGSTTWGFYDRDRATWPAVVARRLAAAGYAADVVDFGQLGYVSVQELLALVLELRRGNVPDAVVFWDGVNDISAARVNGRPGVSYREFEHTTDADFVARMRTAGMRVDTKLAIRSLASHSILLRKLLDATERPATVVPVPQPVPFCRAVMRDWVNQARLVDRLGHAFGFATLVIWQPQWELSDRPQSEYERRSPLTSPSALVSNDAGLDAHRRECARVADSLVAGRAAESIVNLAGLHRGDTATVFLDRNSHTVERATAIEGDTVAALLLARLRAKPRR